MCIFWLSSSIRKVENKCGILKDLWVYRVLAVLSFFYFVQWWLGDDSSFYCSMLTQHDSSSLCFVASSYGLLSLYIPHYIRGNVMTGHLTRTQSLTLKSVCSLDCRYMYLTVSNIYTYALFVILLCVIIIACWFE